MRENIDFTFYLIFLFLIVSNNDIMAIIWIQEVTTWKTKKSPLYL